MLFHTLIISIDGIINILIAFTEKIYIGMTLVGRNPFIINTCMHNEILGEAT